MPTTNSSAVGLALDHCNAWSKQDWLKARKALSDDVKVTSTTTMPGAPKTELDGADAYMDGLRAFAGMVMPDTLELKASVGDERNALILLTVHSDGPPFGQLALHSARLYRFDENDKIKDEQVIFIGLPR
jgi:hypothetical protein